MSGVKSRMQMAYTCVYKPINVCWQMEIGRKVICKMKIVVRYDFVQIFILSLV